MSGLSPIHQSIAGGGTLFDETPTCPEKDFFGQEHIPHHPKAYESIFEPPDDWWVRPTENPITFSPSSLNLAANCIRQYLATRETKDWFHLQVYTVNFDSFYQAMEEDDGLTVLLPFWCWCNAGRAKDTSHRQHRHMLAVSPKGHFMTNVWTRLSGPRNHIRIKHPTHLLKTIDYLSQRKSRSRVANDVRTNLNHYYVNLSLPPGSKWVLACVWEGGLENFIHHEYKYRPIMDLVPIAEKYDDQYEVAVEDLPGLPTNFILPVSRRFIPTDRTTPCFLYLMHGRKLYFQACDEGFGQGLDSEWIALQNEGGNVLHRIIGGKCWLPTRRQQYYLKIIVPLVTRKKELELEIEKLKELTRDEKTLRKRKKCASE